MEKKEKKERKVGEDEGRTLDFNTIKKAINIIFDFDLEVNREFIELSINYNLAAHTDKDNIESVLSYTKASEDNISVAPNTRKLKQGGGKAYLLRTGTNEILRQNTIILDIDSEKSHKEKKAISIEEARELADKVLEKIKKVDKDIYKAIKAIAYTGGGCQIYIKLNKILDNIDDIKKVYKGLENKLRNIKEIDKASFNISQLQRLIGTINQKYNVKTQFLSINEKIKPLEVEKMIEEFYKKERRKAKKEVKEMSKRHLKIAAQDGRAPSSTLKQTINDIKSIGDFADFVNIQEDKGSYYRALCPFHEESNPSFIIYKNPEGQLAIDYHDNARYDIIEFIMKKEKLDHISAIKFLADKYNIEFKTKEEEKKEKLGNSLISALEEAELSPKVLENIRKIDEDIYYNEKEKILIKQKETKREVRTSIFRIHLPPCVEGTIQMFENDETFMNREIFLNISRVIGNILYNDYFIEKIIGEDNVEIEDILKIYNIKSKRSTENIKEIIKKGKDDFMQYISLCYNPICDKQCVETCPLKKYKKDINIKEAIENQGVFEKIKIEIDGKEFTWNGQLVATKRQLKNRLELIDDGLGSIYTSHYIWKQLESKAVKVDSKLQYVDLLVERFWDYLETEDFHEFLMRMEVKINKNNFDQSYIFFRESLFRKMLNNISEIKLEKEDYELFLKKIKAVKSQNRVFKMPTRTIRFSFENIKNNTELFYKRLLLDLFRKDEYLPEEVKSRLKGLLEEEEKENKEEIEKEEINKEKVIEIVENKDETDKTTNEENETDNNNTDRKEDNNIISSNENVNDNEIVEIMLTEKQKELKDFIDKLLKRQINITDIQIDGKRFKDLDDIILNIADIDDDLLTKIIDYLTDKVMTLYKEEEE